MNVSQRRLLQLFAFLAAWALVIVARLVHVQLVKHDHYVARAQRQQERTLDLNPVRGSILDSRERVLAESVRRRVDLRRSSSDLRSPRRCPETGQGQSTRPDRARARDQAAGRRQLRLDRAATAARSQRGSEEAAAPGYLLSRVAAPLLSAGDARRKRHWLRRRRRRQALAASSTPSTSTSKARPGK